MKMVKLGVRGEHNKKKKKKKKKHVQRRRGRSPILKEKARQKR